MKEGQPVEDGQRIANEFKSKLGIKEEDMEEAAYIDLLAGS